MAAWDWYSATVPHPVDDVLEAVAGLASGLKVGYERAKQAYGSTATLGNDEDGIVARVMHGGSHEYPHVVLSGQWAQPGSELIRAAFPDHRVARADVREDFGEEGAYDAIQEQLLVAARAHRVRVGTAGDHLLTKTGRTCYLGAPTSNVRVRLYDKREEVLSKLPPAGPERMRAWRQMGGTIPDHWTRLEAQIRPHTREAKVAFATIQPEAAFGATNWTRDVFQAVTGLELKRVNVGPIWRPSDDERALRFMVRQYGPLLRRMRADLGSWECVGLQLGEELK